MSLKPKKHSEIKKIEAKMKQSPSKMGSREQLPPYTMIVCEGVKTEPLYLKGLVDKINGQYKDIVKEGHIKVYGTGRNTKGLLNFVDRQVKKGYWEKFENIWLVYDKDDFPMDNFDNTQFSAENRNSNRLKVAWSNESFELWLLLHFQNYEADNGRTAYIEKLNEYLDYSKTREDLYDVITSEGSLDDAKKRARKMYENFIESGISTPSKMVPATRVYELVEELEMYLN